MVRLFTGNQEKLIDYDGEIAKKFRYQSPVSNCQYGDIFECKFLFKSLRSQLYKFSSRPGGSGWIFLRNNFEITSLISYVSYGHDMWRLNRGKNFYQTAN